MEVYPDCTPTSAEQAASMLMARPEMKEALQERLDELNAKDLVTVEGVLSRLLKRAKTAKREADQNKADELLGKYLRLWADEGNKVQVNLISDNDLQKIRAKLAAKKKDQVLTDTYEGKDVEKPVIAPNEKLEGNKDEGKDKDEKPGV